MTDDLPRRVRAARAYAGLSQEELGARLGGSYGLVKRLERGDRDPTIGELARMADVCGVPLWFLALGWER